MATRFYMGRVTAPDISPAYAAEWERQGSAFVRYVLDNPKVTGAIGNLSNAEGISTTSDQDIIALQYISAALGAQTISGTFQCTIQVAENNAAANFRAQIIVRVVSEDGATVRGTLYAGDLATLTGDPTDEFNASSSVFHSRWFPRGGSTALSSLAIQNGDRLVVEVGWRAHNTASTSYTATFRMGEPSGGDLSGSETATSTTLAPWIEFSQNLTWKTTETPIGASDSGVFTGTESATVSAAIPAADSGVFSGSESPSIAASQPAPDSGAFSGNESPSVVAQVPAGDAGSFTGTETASVSATVPAADAGVFSASESVSIAEIASKDAQDSGAFSGTEIPTIVASIPASDTGAFSGSESASVAAQAPASDSGSFVASEAVSVALGASDAGVVQGNEAATIVAASQAADSGTFSGDESASISGSRGVSDTGVFTGTEFVTVSITGVEIPAADSGVFSVNESATTSAVQARADGGVFSANETTSINKGDEPVLAADGGVLSVGESVGIAAHVSPFIPGELGNTFIINEDPRITALTPVSDSGVFSASELVSIRKINEPKIAAESGQFAITEDVSIRVMVQAQDGGMMQANEQTSRVWTEMLIPSGSVRSILGRLGLGQAFVVSAASGRGPVVGLGTPGEIRKGTR